MRKVMIVDDEKWVRKGLIQSISWDRLGLELAGEAADGREAYEMARRLRPDILFLDMRMPGVDGKELIGMLNRDMPGMITIVVSGYSDFEYTKEAIRNKAFEYLLKPVKKEELAQVLEKALSELGAQEAVRSKADRSSRIDWLRRTLFALGSDQAMAEGADASQAERALPAYWKSGACLVLVGQTDVYAEAGAHCGLAAGLRERLTKEKPFLFGGRWDFMTTIAPGEAGEIVLAIAAEKLEEAGAQRLAAFFRQMQAQPAGPDASFGMSGIRPPSELAQAYEEARAALKRKPIGSVRAILSHAADAASGGGAASSYPAELETALLLALQVGHPQTVEQQFGKWFREIAAPGRTVDFMQRSAILLVHAIEKQLQAEEARFEEICGKHPSFYTDALDHRNDPASVRALLEQGLIDELIAHDRPAGEKQGEQILREVKKLIDTHYAQPLSMLQIAGMHYMNPDYLSRLFKRMTGSNFVDYLTDVRIEKAKGFMLTGIYKNYEIAQMVGYEDYRYFSQIFKKKMGMTIGEYRGSLNAAVESPESKEQTKR